MTNAAPTTAELAAASWKTSTYSAANNECVEIAALSAGAWVGLRDSKREDGPAVTVRAPAFIAVLDAVRAGAL
jgi:hypothetical protein